jgi:D-alanine-D-alanine ligase
MRKMTSRSSSSSPRRTIGPIADLERHLPEDWWKSLFNSLYLRTDGDVVENDENTKTEVDLLVRACRLEAGDRILDLCCGQGRHSLELARRAFRNVVGIDRSRYLIRLARSRARKEGLSVRFQEGEARRPRAQAGSFDCVAVLGNSFGYFDAPDDDLIVLHAILRALRPGGVLLLDVADGAWLRENFEDRSWEWIDQDHFVCRERSLSRDERRLISREVIVNAERGVLADQFYAERLFSPDQLRALCESCGFESIAIHDPLQARSRRGGDLGMMAHRTVLTGRAPRKARVRRRRVALCDVTVLLGDPELPDAVKREGRFNPEDLETVDRLKSALEELEEYRFAYLDRHDALIRILTDKPPELAFNLCDEGFENDAFKELHVPGLLEMLGVPYTGAGPGCLALCFNKAFVRAIAVSLDIPVPAEICLDPGDRTARIPTILPALVKPALGDSSIGITKDAVVQSAEELVDYVRRLGHSMPGRPVLVQEFLEGSEYTVALIGNPARGYTILPPLEVDYSALDPGLPRILGYESKWIPESPYWDQIQYRCAELSDEDYRRITEASVALFERLECRDYARFDFRTDSRGEIKLLEVNPNPGWCWDGKLNLMAGFQGLRYSQLLGLILQTARERIEDS